MNRETMKGRTRDLALRIIRLASSLPRSQVGRVLGDQILRAGTSVGANYRAAQRARSTREFDARLGVVEEECDETAYWLELLAKSGLVARGRLESLIQETSEILAIVVTARKNSRS